MTTDHTETPIPKIDPETQFMIEQKQIERNYLKMLKKAEQMIKQNEEITEEMTKKIEETNNQNEELIKQSKQMDDNIIISSLGADHTKTPVPKIDPELQFMVDRAIETKKTIASMFKQNEEIVKHFEKTKNMVSYVKEISQQINKNKRKRSIEPVKIKKENKKIKISKIPRIQRTPCPSCMSWKTTGFLYSEEKGEWIYACRETNIINSSNGCCGNMWIESDRTPTTQQCICGGYFAYISIRKQKSGYDCSECDIFKAF